MLPFPVELKPGLPIAGQVIHAVKKAVLTGRLTPGDRFVSVRQMSQELRINPNTAHRIVAALVQDGVLVATPAVGTVVAEPPPGSRQDKAELLGPELEQLVVNARQLGLRLPDVQAALLSHWRRLGGEKETLS
ncbi:MAG: GntR family transcriptional regulator [Opitutaceae bacterium]|nr:GntR family transcriptional regulator [Opitutaceae bacterium]